MLQPSLHHFPKQGLSVLAWLVAGYGVPQSMLTQIISALCQASQFTTVFKQKYYVLFSRPEYLLVSPYLMLVCSLQKWKYQSNTLRKTLLSIVPVQIQAHFGIWYHFLMTAFLTFREEKWCKRSLLPCKEQ